MGGHKTIRSTAPEVIAPPVSHWISPASHYDGSYLWINPTRVYDDSVITYSTCLVQSNSQSAILRLTIAPMTPCDKIRFFVHPATSVLISTVRISVWYGGFFRQIYSGPFVRSEWIEKLIPAGMVYTSAAEISFRNGSLALPVTVALSEFEFWQII